MRLQIPNRTGGLVSRREFNGAIETLEASIPRGMAHKTTRGVIPRISAKTVRAAAVAPLQTVGVNGFAATITGSYSSATPYLWFNIGANTAEWKSSTLAPFPLDTIILDGRAGYGSEYWHMR